MNSISGMKKMNFIHPRPSDWDTDGPVRQAVQTLMMPRLVSRMSRMATGATNRMMP